MLTVWKINVKGCMRVTEGQCFLPLLQFDLIQDNLKYFLEMLQNKKSDFLEYMIVILIALEIAVSLFDIWTRDALSKIA